MNSTPKSVHWRAAAAARARKKRGGNGDNSPEERKQRQSELDVLMSWVTERLSSMAAVPRVEDVVKHAYTVLGFRKLKRAEIARRLRLHPAYLMTSAQTRGRTRWKRYRPIITNTLGMLHGDIGFFAVRREYETPARYRSGYLVLKDILSRFTYVVILRGSKGADAMVRALSDALEQHERFFGGSNGHRIKSLAFDQETSVMSKKVQDFLRANHIAFHPFQFSTSKSKMAEGAIRLIRNTVARLLLQHPTMRWWKILDAAVLALNSRPIKVNGKTLSWTPMDVNAGNLARYRRAVLKADPVQYFGQFEINPSLVRFKYAVGSVVRPKLLVTSSAVVGEKRSEVSLEADAFVVTQQQAYVNARFEAGRAYRCVNLRTRQEEIFDESDLAESVGAVTSKTPE
jgi:hypothetical protein